LLADTTGRVSGGSTCDRIAFKNKDVCLTTLGQGMCNRAAHDSGADDDDISRFTHDHAVLSGQWS
jgi:hypothetical protein